MNNRIHSSSLPNVSTVAWNEARVNDLGQVICSLNCYEPNSQRLELTGEDLCRNTLFVGTVGSGKTTCMNPLLRDVIAYRAQEADAKVGLLVMDSKLDDTAAKIQAWARQVQRENDVIVLSPGGSHYYDFLADLTDFNSLETIVEKIVSSINWEHDGNAYWQHGRKPLLKAALAIVLVNCLSQGISPDYPTAIRFIQEWLLVVGRPGSMAENFIKEFQDQVPRVSPLLAPGEQAILNEALAVIRMWQDLDVRTKSNWSSVLTNCLSPFSDMAAQAYFCGQNRKRLVLSDIVESGQIVVLSINAGENPALASLLGRLIKADFYQTLQNRQLAYANAGRLVGLVMDEYPLVVTGTQPRFGDIAQLQTLRSKRAFVVAATQGFTSLDMVVGRAARTALLLNFNNLFLFSSHEAEVDAFAIIHFGHKPGILRASLEWENARENSDIATYRHHRKLKAQVEEWSCPPGALGRLDVGQAYVSLARGRRILEPVWLEPLYFEPPIRPARPAGSRQTELKQIFRKSAPVYPETELEDTSAGWTQDYPENGPGIQGQEEALDPNLLKVYFAPKEYTHLFENSQGLFSRYFKAWPQQRQKIDIAPQQFGDKKMIAVTFPVEMVEAVRHQFPGRTPTDRRFLKNYAIYLQQTKTAPEGEHQ